MGGLGGGLGCSWNLFSFFPRRLSSAILLPGEPELHKHECPLPSSSVRRPAFLCSPAPELFPPSGLVVWPLTIPSRAVVFWLPASVAVSHFGLGPSPSLSIHNTASSSPFATRHVPCSYFPLTQASLHSLFDSTNTLSSPLLSCCPRAQCLDGPRNANGQLARAISCAAQRRPERRSVRHSSSSLLHALVRPQVVHM